MRITVFKTPVICHLLQALAWIMLKLTGWAIEGQKPTERRFVLVGAPHTSNWDFILFMAIALRMGTPLYWMGKHTLFKGPMGLVMRYFGGIPVNRHQRNNLVDQVVKAFNTHEQFVLAIAPEGTRSQVNKWKSGFWHMASKAGVPVIPAYVDAPRKVGGLGKAYPLSDNKDRDIANLQAFYRPFLGINPQFQTSLDAPPPVETSRAA